MNECRCYSGKIEWLDSCGCCMSWKYCDCPKGVAAKEEAEAVEEFKAQRRALQEAH